MIRVLVPATSANCSIGFDSLGMALEWRSVFTFEESEEFKVTGCDPEFANENNLVVQAFRLTAQTFGRKCPSFICIRKPISLWPEDSVLLQPV